MQEWFRWYSRSVADAVVWVVRALRERGYAGDVHFPLAGRGALPGDLEEALAARLDGTADRDGSLEGGLFYPEQLPYVAESLARTERRKDGGSVGEDRIDGRTDEPGLLGHLGDSHIGSVGTDRTFGSVEQIRTPLLDVDARSGGPSAPTPCRSHRSIVVSDEAASRFSAHRSSNDGSSR